MQAVNVELGVEEYARNNGRQICSSASISSDGHYAFVEFATIDEANKAFVLNNRTILGSSIKVSRPKTY